MCWFYMGIAQIALDPPPSVKQANMEKKVPQTILAFQKGASLSELFHPQRRYRFIIKLFFQQKLEPSRKVLKKSFKADWSFQARVSTSLTEPLFEAEAAMTCGCAKFKRTEKHGSDEGETLEHWRWGERAWTRLRNNLLARMEKWRNAPGSDDVRATWERWQRQSIERRGDQRWQEQRQREGKYQRIALKLWRIHSSLLKTSTSSFIPLSLVTMLLRF